MSICIEGALPGAGVPGVPFVPSPALQHFWEGGRPGWAVPPFLGGRSEGVEGDGAGAGLGAHALEPHRIAIGASARQPGEDG
jgi:hypothetical protein